jgi:hypothetical protein
MCPPGTWCTPGDVSYFSIVSFAAKSAACKAVIVVLLLEVLVC